MHKTKTAGLTIALVSALALTATAPATAGGKDTTTTPIAMSSSTSRTSAAPLTLNLTDPSGKPARLTYIEGRGWEYAKDAPAEQSLLKRVFFAKTATKADKAASEVEEPMTVFIDGPTGFTYVWSRDAGWKFVGQVNGRGR